MQFQSEGFILLFLPIAILLSFIPGRSLRALILILLSYAFYSAANPFFVVLLFITSSTAFVGGTLIGFVSSNTLRLQILWSIIAINLLILAYFKYLFFFSDNIHHLGQAIGFSVSLDKLATSPALDFILPAGISFYTFQALSYVIDVYRRQIEPERDILRFFAFVSFWPQLVAGPIERYGILGPQIGRYIDDKKIKRYWIQGLDRFALGVIQKIIIADSCGMIVNQLSANVSNPDFFTSWGIAIGFGMQIFFDFVAYTNMAIGTAALFGIRISENFFSPYRATSIQDFWHRWHVTLSIWFRDYVYIPLGGGRFGFTIQLKNIMIVFFVTGLWHGAGWNFVVWGLLHGFMLAVFLVIKRIKPAPTLPTFASIGITFTLVHFAWVPFRLTDMKEVLQVWQGMLGLQGFAMPASLSPWDVAFLIVVTALAVFLPNSSERWPGKSGLFESFALWVCAALALIYAPEVSNFIYFQF